MGKIAKKYSGDRGFTLVEMLAVMGIMITMMTMLLPALNDVLNSRGRKAAVNMLLNSFEQARVAALEQSTDVYIGFADQSIPNKGVGDQNEGFPYTRFIIFRNFNAEIDPIPAGAPPKYVVLTKWLQLPKGISFKSGTSTLVDGQSGGTEMIASGDNFPSIKSTYSMPVLKFNSTGVIEKPTSNLSLFIYEGFWSGSNEVFTRSNNNNLFEKISLSRYTGRAQLEITQS